MDRSAGAPAHARATPVHRYAIGIGNFARTALECLLQRKTPSGRQDARPCGVAGCVRADRSLAKTVDDALRRSRSGRRRAPPRRRGRVSDRDVLRARRARARGAGRDRPRGAQRSRRAEADRAHRARRCDDAAGGRARAGRRRASDRALLARTADARPSGACRACRPRSPAAARGSASGSRVIRSRSALVDALDEPLTATSANPGGEDPAVDLATARRYFASRVAAYVDGGTLAGGLGSTVVLVADDAARVIRRGATPLDELADALGTTPLDCQS